MPSGQSLPQVLLVGLDVNQRGVDRPMTQRGLDEQYVTSALVQIGREAVAKRVRRYLTWGVFVKDRKPRKTEEKAE